MRAETVRQLTLPGSKGLLSSIQTIDSVSFGRWWDGVQTGTEHSMFNFNGLSQEMRDRLDRYINLKIGNSKLLDSFKISETMSQDYYSEIYRDISTILLSNQYTLDNMFYSTLLEFRPLDNYDRLETQTHNDSSTIGSRKTTNTVGARENTTTSSQKTTAFDTVDYSKGTDQNSETYHSDGAIDVTSVDSATDSTNGGYTLRAHGNIGTTKSSEMLRDFQEVALYNFFDKVIDIIKENITTMLFF